MAPETKKTAPADKPKPKSNLRTLIEGAGRWDWFQDRTIRRCDDLFATCDKWRARLDKYQLQMENDFSQRAKDKSATGWQKIFALQNDTMSVVGTFADYFAAQAINDIFGSRPWLKAKPVGKSDIALADELARHSQWKFDRSNISESYEDAIKRATCLGTSFPKWGYNREVEEYERTAEALHVDGSPVVDENGNYVERGNGQIPEMDDPSQPQPDFRPIAIQEKRVVFNGCEVYDISHRDIAFDLTSPEFDLRHTEIFNRVRIHLLDARRIYELDDETCNLLAASAIGAAVKETGRNPEHNRPEQTPPEVIEGDWNCYITIFEGYQRLDPVGDGVARRVFTVHEERTRLLIVADYLQDRTPNGEVPIKPIRCNKLPGRAYGVGFYEKYESQNNYCDAHLSVMGYRTRRDADPWTGVDRSKIVEDEDDPGDDEYKPDPEKTIQLQAGAKINDAIQFVQIPADNRNDRELMDIMVSMMQLRTGISAASQGDVGSVPDNSTATGIKQMMNRAMVLLKQPIDKIKRDIEAGMAYGVKLLYSNHDVTETFTYGEGENEELVSITPEKVRGLDLDVTLSMMASQNQDKLESGNAAIELMLKYMTVPEVEKASLRPLFIQSLQGLGFDHADMIVRQPVEDLTGLMAILPPDIQQAFAAFVQAQQAQQAAAPGQPQPQPGPPGQPAEQQPQAAQPQQPPPAQAP